MAGTRTPAQRLKNNSPHDAGDRPSRNGNGKVHRHVVRIEADKPLPIRKLHAAISAAA